MDAHARHALPPAGSCLSCSHSHVSTHPVASWCLQRPPILGAPSGRGRPTHMVPSLKSQEDVRHRNGTLLTTHGDPAPLQWGQRGCGPERRRGCPRAEPALTLPRASGCAYADLGGGAGPAGGGAPSDRTPTHIGHKAGGERLLEYRVPVHVGQVGCALQVAEAGQAALGVLGQELGTQGKVFA